MWVLYQKDHVSVCKYKCIKGLCLVPSIEGLCVILGTHYLLITIRPDLLRFIALLRHLKIHLDLEPYRVRLLVAVNSIISILLGCSCCSCLCLIQFLHQSYFHLLPLK